MVSLTPYMLDRFRARELAQQKRILSQASWQFDFSSNDYLSLARSAIFKERILQKVRDFDFVGASGSRLLTGNRQLAVSVESQIAAFFGFSSALVFPSGFSLNVGLLPAISHEKDCILMDENAHASLKNGLKLANATGYFFRHNDLEHLTARLKRQRVNGKSENIFIVVESVYSMDGDIAPLVDLISLCREFSANLIVDEAHAVGALGDRGCGLVSHLGLQEEVFATVLGFGKGLGCHGAAVLGSTQLKEYLINFCHSFMYTTGLPVFSLVAMQEALLLCEQDRASQERLHQRIHQFNEHFDYDEHPSPIYSFPFSDTARLREAASSLQAHGYGVLPIYSPTVRVGTERLRVSLHAHNTEEELRNFSAELEKFL